MSTKVNAEALELAVKAVDNLKNEIDTVNDERYMDQCLINGEINNIITSLNALNDFTYGCFCDNEFGDDPDSVCVMDPEYDGPITDCVFATEGGDKFKCSEWRPFFKK